MLKVLLMLAALLAIGVIVVGTLAAAIANWFVSDPSHTTQCAQTPACAIVFAAETLEYHLEGVELNQYPTDASGEPTDPVLKPVFDQWLKPICGGYVCYDIASGTFQCVSFIKAAWYLAGIKLTDHPNAIDWWTDYAGKSGWQEIGANDSPPEQRGLAQPGDIIIWSNGGTGHIGIVVGVQAPTVSGQNGWVEIAQGNGPGNRWPGTPWPGNYYRMTYRPDLSLITWRGYSVRGFIRLTTWPNLSPANLPDTSSSFAPNVGIANNAANQVGLPPPWFAEQIEQTSGFDPNFTRNGQEGIAGFPSALLATLSPPVDPYDPQAALNTLALLMGGYNAQEGGDYAAALAYYANYATDPGQLLRCQSGHDPGWLACLPGTIQQVVLAVLYDPHVYPILS